MFNELLEMGQRAKAASAIIGQAGAVVKTRILHNIATTLAAQANHIITENQKDLAAAKAAGLSPAMQDRLLLTPERIASMAQSVRDIAALPDPIGAVLSGMQHPNGMEIIKKVVPLGVVGVIYEARPNVTIDCAVLCVKSGNACILKGGKEAIHSNTALAGIVRYVLEQAGFTPNIVQLVEDTSHEAATALMQLNEWVDVLIPRGGIGLITSVVQNATVPVIETGAGVNHLYIDEYADINTGLTVLKNAKISRPGVCNALETLLVHDAIAADFLPKMAEFLQGQVHLHACGIALPYLPGATPAMQEDWETEYLDHTLAVRVVDSMDEALAHIATYSTKHSETIITQNYNNAQRFAAMVDAAAVYLNASSRFTDGGEFGLGAEIGISTQKLHVRGPMGLTALTTYKYIIRGNGQVRE